jgi:hypothetical protein
MMKMPRRFGNPILVLGALSASALPAAEKLALLDQRLELPGVPIEMLSPDLDGDGLADLAVVVGGSTWGETAFTEEAKLDDTGTFVDVLTVVPTVLDRRQLLLFRGLSPGGFETAPKSLDLGEGVHAVAAGPSGAPLLAWTDGGIAEVTFDEGGELVLDPRIATRSLLSGSRSYVPRAGLARDFDGDGEIDVLLPVSEGLALHRGTKDGVEATASALLTPPRNFDLPPKAKTEKRKQDEDDEGEDDDDRGDRDRRRRATSRIEIPELVDLDGDRRPDLVYRDPDNRRSRLRGRLSLGGGRFGPPYDPLAGAELDEGREISWIGELDGAPGAELVISQEVPNEKETMRAELDEAKRPRSRVAVHALDAGGVWNPAPRSAFEIEGYVFEGGEGGEGGEGSGGDDGDGDGFEFSLPAGVRDLDGDGRLDLVAIRLDFSLFEAMRILTTRSIKLGLDFGVYRQGEASAFRAVPDLDLSGELKLRLDDVSLGQISSFAGDFDGDGRADFVQLGRGKKMTVHRGQEGARYAPKADLVVTLEREPDDVALVKVLDFDGDGRSDIVVTQPIGGGEIGARAALELHLSRGAK